MGSLAVGLSTTTIQESFADLERQQELITSCTQLWKELSNHFTTLDHTLTEQFASLSRRRTNLDLSLTHALDKLHRRELSIDASVDLALSKVDSLLAASPPSSNQDLASQLRSLCAKMDAHGFWDLIVSKRKEMDVLRSDVPVALMDCIDPAKFAMDAIWTAVKSPGELGWACVLILESLGPALADPELGTARMMVTRAVRERAREMSGAWKEGIERRGVEDSRPADLHAFLQHLVTFGVGGKEDREFYGKIVMSIAWRKQMPKLAISLGLEDRMPDMIEELVSKGQQLDAINFVYEAGLQDKFPPVPLLKSFLEDAKKAAASNLEDHNNSGQATFNAGRKEQSAIRAVMKCIEDRKLEAEFPLEELEKRLENVEKAKIEKKKSPSPSGPANKRTRANVGGPMPPAKAGRYLSFPPPAAPSFVRSPSAHTTYPSSAPLYGHGVYGTQSPVYGSQSPPYMPSPVNYPPYGSYNNGMGGYTNGMAPAVYHQQAYYR